MGNYMQLDVETGTIQGFKVQGLGFRTAWQKCGCQKSGDLYAV